MVSSVWPYFSHFLVEADIFWYKKGRFTRGGGEVY